MNGESDEHSMWWS